MRSEGLKAISELFTPDERNLFFKSVDPQTGDVQDRTLEDHYCDIEQFRLNDAVPDKIAIQYDIARNIYIYAWFEYHFFNIAEMKAFAVLEFAIKERVGKKILNDYLKQHKKRKGLQVCIEYCMDHQLLVNEKFSAWHRFPEIKARMEYEFKKMEEMRGKGLDEIVLDYSEVKAPAGQNTYDYIQLLIDTANKVRNEYMHGSNTLHANILPTFEMVSEFINQLYPD